MRDTLGVRDAVLERVRACDAVPLFAWETVWLNVCDCEAETEAVGVPLKELVPDCVAETDGLPEEDAVEL